MTTKDAPPKVVTLAQSDALNATPPMRLDPQALIAKAIEAGANVETLERLVNLAKDIRAISAREAFFEAKAKFKERCGPIKKKKTAMIESRTGRSYSYKYSPLDEVSEIVDPILSPLGLSYSWEHPRAASPGHVASDCILTHMLGHSEHSGPVEVPYTLDGRMNGAQAVGSALTYSKRYSLLGILGVVAEDDDDAGATGSARPEARETRMERESVAPDDPGLVKESQTLFESPLGEEHHALDAKIGQHTPSRIAVMMRRFDLGEGEWQKLDLASKAMLAKHLEAKAK